MASRSSRLAAAVALAAVLGGCLSPHAGYREARALTDKRLHVETPAFEDDVADASIAALLDAPLTAEAAVRVAVLRSKRVRAAFDRVGVARGELASAIALPNPSVEGNVRFRLERADGAPDVDLGLGVDLRELVLLPLRHRAASNELDAAAIEATSDVMEVALEARLAYVDHVAATQALELELEVARSLEASSELATAIAEAGNENGSRALAEQAAFEEAKLALEGAALQVAATRVRLNEQMGLAGDEADRWMAPTRLADPTGDEPSVEATVAAALDTSLELAMATSRTAALDAASTTARVEGALPRIEAGAIAERDPEGWALGPQIAIGLPIFNQNVGEVDRLEAEARRATHLGEALALSIRTRAATLARALETLRRRVDAFATKILPARAALVEQTQRLYNAMGTSPFELFQAKRDQIAAARGWVEALRDYWRTRAELDLLLAGHLAGHAVD